MATPQLDSPLKRLSLVDSVYETLLQAIVSGGLSPGAELNSVELAEQLDVSRTPVKEAIKLLTHDGLARQRVSARPEASPSGQQRFCRGPEQRLHRRVGPQTPL